MRIKLHAQEVPSVQRTSRQGTDRTLVSLENCRSIGRVSWEVPSYRGDFTFPNS